MRLRLHGGADRFLERQAEIWRRAKADGRTWLTWDEWREFFALARKCNVWKEIRRDGKVLEDEYEGNAFVCGLPISRGIHLQYMRCLNARAVGMSAEDFSITEFMEGGTKPVPEPPGKGTH